MDHIGHAKPADTNEQSISLGRRALLRAGWTIPVIAATPLMNTASAVSAVNCDKLITKLHDKINAGDVAGAQDVVKKIIESGCTW